MRTYIPITISIALLIFLFGCGGKIDLSGSRLSCESSDCPDGYHCNEENYCIADDNTGDDNAGDDDTGASNSTNGNTDDGGIIGTRTDYFSAYTCGEKPDNAKCDNYVACTSCCQDDDDPNKCNLLCKNQYVINDTECALCINTINSCGSDKGCKGSLESDEFWDCVIDKCPTEVVNCFGIPG